MRGWMRGEYRYVCTWMHVNSAWTIHKQTGNPRPAQIEATAVATTKRLIRMPISGPVVLSPWDASSVEYIRLNARSWIIECKLIIEFLGLAGISPVCEIPSIFATVDGSFGNNCTFVEFPRYCEKTRCNFIIAERIWREGYIQV